MRSLTFSLLFVLFGAASIAYPAKAATPTEVDFDRIEGADQAVASVAIVQQNRIMCRHYQLRAVEVKAKAIKNRNNPKTTSENQNLAAMLVVQLAKKANIEVAV